MKNTKKKSANRGDVHADISEQRNEIAFMQKKAHRYCKAIRDLKMEMFDKGMCDPETISQANLKENTRKNEELAKELENLNKKLALFRGLPTNIELAKMKLEEAKRELEKLENRLSHKLSM